jgi:hypothetical protein
MAYAALTTIQTLNTGDILTAACMQQVNANGEFLIDPPAASVYNNAAQSVANGSGSATALTANSEYFDNDTMHSTSVNTSRITATTAGRYLFVAQVQFAANATGNRRVGFLHNGTTTYQSALVGGTGTNSTILTAVKLLTLAATDYVECTVWQTSGGNLDVTLLEYGATFLTR